MQTLKKGGTVALVSPGAIADPVALQAAVSGLEGCGFRVKVAGLEHGTASRTPAGDRLRAESVNRSFRDTQVDAIFCARGGYGSGRVADYLNYDLIADNQKIFVGYSDITYLLLPLFSRASLVGFHGPVGVELFRNKNDTSRQQFFEVLTGQRRAFSFAGDKVQCIKPGRAEGAFVGGNLSILSSMVGTNGFSVPPGSILFIEDVNEFMYHIDRAMTHLWRAGVFCNAAGIVFGESVIRDPGEDNSLGLSLHEMLEELFADFEGPVVCGVPLGHTKDQITLPFGANLALNATSTSVELSFGNIFDSTAGDHGHLSMSA